MSTLRLPRFAVPAILKSIDLSALVDLLRQEGGDYVGDVVDLDAAPDAFDYDELALLLANPRDGYPDRLADALHHIHEVADEQGLEAMLDRMQAQGIHLDVEPLDPTPADLAVRLWLLDPDLVETTHAEKFISRPKSFESWLGTGNGRDRLPPPSDPKLRALEAAFDDYFEKRKRGRHSRVFVFTRPEATYFLIRHGMPMDRRGIIKDGQSTSSFERPEKHDVVSYWPACDELRVNASTKGEKDLYRRQIGKHVFGNEDYFPDNGTGKFTLQPLVDLGRDALACDDIEGIDAITLQEVKLFHGGNAAEVVTRRAVGGDLFAVLEAQGRDLPRAPFQASFRVTFTGAKTARTVRIKAPNVAMYTRESDEDVVSRWLTARGFVQDTAGDEQAA
ncbi:MAG: hypothetical protein EA397_17245 [Deltaproteobacteria bacterium]|nr:MAG: hypothetical protein EA397_17245 [Deltaproteobacteria bacterium]